MSAMGHSGRFSLRMAMRSPAPIPDECRAWAVLATPSPNLPDVTGSHFPPSRYSIMRSRLRSTAAKKMSFRVAMLIAFYGAPRQRNCAGMGNSSEKNCTVLPVLWAMRLVTLLGTSRCTIQATWICRVITLWEDSRMQRTSLALLWAGLLLATTAAPTVAQTKKEDSSMPKVGDMAPDFTLKHFDGNDLKDVKLSDYRGKKNVVLAFYIFAFTGG